jgi:nitric oxide dioxygenase
MLTESQKDLVKSTVPVLKEHGVALTQYFYQRMLDHQPALKETFNLGHQRSGTQATALANAVLAYAENIDDPSPLLPVVEFIAHKHVSLNIQSPDYAIVGEHLLHSMSEVLKVPMDAELIAAWAAAYGKLADLFIVTEQRLYQQKQAQEGNWLGWRAFKVVIKVVESSEISSFYLQPVDANPLPDYKAGQYISVKVFVPELGLKQPRQYTLSDSPNGTTFRISVKREDQQAAKAAGWVSNTLHQHTQVGDVVEVTSPSGLFYLLDSHKANVLISGGVGLTPMIAMLNHLTSANTQQTIQFLHACRGGEVHAMKPHIQQLKDQHPNLKTLVAYELPKSSDTQGQDYDVAGRLDLSLLSEDWLPVHADYYLCGPLPFMQAQHQSLLARGIPAEHIHSEVFGTGGTGLH